MTQADIPIPAKPAGLLARVGAAAYDGLLLLALFFLATAVIDPFLESHHVPPGSLWFRLYLLIIVFLFYGWFWTHGGQTLGMRAWRLRVVDQNGNAVRWPRAALRLVTAGPVWMTVVGLLFCLGGKPALHDRLSGTQVVRLPKP